MLIDTLTSDLLNSRKARNAFQVSVLSTIVGNLKSNAVLVEGEKVVTDEAAVAYIKKHIKGLEEVLEHADGDKRDFAKDELKIVEKYLPQQMAEAEIRQILDHEKFSSMKDFMAYMKTNHAGLYDGKLASQLFNQG